MLTFFEYFLIDLLVDAFSVPMLTLFESVKIIGKVKGSTSKVEGEKKSGA